MAQAHQILDHDDLVFSIENGNSNGCFLFLCEHASNYIPECYQNLGLNKELRKSHIAWDPGALKVAEYLAESLDSPLIKQNVSRLVYDCNRPPSAKSAIPETSEIFEIPGNRNLNEAQINQRIDQVYLPFKHAVEDFISKKIAIGQLPIVVTIHTFTPIYHGKKREVEIGILHDADPRLADALFRSVNDYKQYLFERNQPYGPDHGVTHSLIEYGIKNGLANVMLEIRSDLVVKKSQQQSVANLLAASLKKAVADLELHKGSVHA